MHLYVPPGGAPYVPADPELAYALAVASFYALDRFLSALPPEEPLPAGEIGAVVRLIKEAREYSVNGRAAND